MLWYVICQVGGKHVTDNCHLLQKYIQILQQLYCNFCRSVGHDERMCLSYDLMIERTPANRMQTEAWRGFQGCGRGRGMGPGRGHGPLICYNCGELGNYARNCTNQLELCAPIVNNLIMKW